MQKYIPIVSWQGSSSREKAERLATKLELPIMEPSPLTQKNTKSNENVKLNESQTYYLVVTEKRLELRYGSFQSKTKIYAEFLSGPLGYRRLHGGGFKQLIAKAIGLKGRAKNPPTVLDVTAGLGRDAFVLASLGCTVCLIERSPIIAALLLDGLERASVDPTIGPIIKERMQVLVGEASVILEALKLEPDNALKHAPQVVYLDPMFPLKHKSALTKIEMRIIRDIVGDDKDAPDILQKALNIARERVVVKRPSYAPPLAADRRPDFVVESTKNRYDIYLA